ncbi:MAG: DUF2281 domain-containing protein [Bacteroidota bacterium]
MSAIQLYSQLIKMPLEMRRKVAAYIESLLNQNPPPSSPKKKMIPGLAEGMIIMKENFDDPIEDFKDYM